MFNFGKTKKKRKEKELTIPEKWEKGMMTAEEVLDITSVRFVGNAMLFFENNQSIKAQIKKHNNANKEYQKRADDIASGKDYPQKNLDLMLLKMHKANRNDILDNIVFRNQVNLSGGCVQLECLKECIESRDDGTLDTTKDSFIKRCMSEKTIAKAMKAIEEDNLSYVPVSEEQMSWFYDAARQFLLLMILEDDKDVNVTTDSMFNEHGAVMLLDENNRFYPAEEDMLLAYKEIDYKGLV